MAQIQGIYGASGRIIKGVDGIYSGQKITGDIQSTEKISFANLLSEQINKVNEMGLDADKKVSDQFAGKEINPHESVIALQKAEISFHLLSAVRDKVITAYQEIMRTSL